MLTIDYDHKNDWYYEGQISKKIVDYLISENYSIIKDNSENCHARGEDIIAISREGIKEIIEIKGYPTKFHTKGEKKGQPKPTDPKLQAKHWFSEAILSSIFNHKKHRQKNNFILALGFPKKDRYLELMSKVETYFTDNNIDFKVFIVDNNGEVTISNLNTNLRSNE